MRIELDRKTVRIYFQYNKDLVRYIKVNLKSLGVKYEPANPHWYFKLSGIRTESQLSIIEQFLFHYQGFQVDSLAAKALENISQTLRTKENTKNEQTKKLADIAKTVINESSISGRKLYKHQQYGVEWLVQGSRILADDLGVGKTATIAATAKCWKIYNPDFRIIVICPKNLKKNIKLEFADFGVDPEIYSYGSQPTHIDGEYVLFADEIHLCGNISSKRSKAFLNLADDAVAVYPVSGTPCRSGRPRNLFPILKAIKHPLSFDRVAFSTRYCDLKSTRFTKYDDSGAKNLDELHLLTKDYILQRKKRDCIDLPPFTRVFRDIEPTKEELNDFVLDIELLKKDYYRRLNNGEIKSGGEKLVFLGHIRRVASAAKLNSVCELIDDILEQGDSVVVFSVYKETVKQIADKYGFYLLTGDLSDENYRDDIVRKFQVDNVKGFASTISAGGVGITLTKANHVILIDREWNPPDNEQAEARLERLSQVNPVTSYWVRYGKYDEHVDNILIDKSKRITQMLEGKRKTMRGKSIEDAAEEILIDIFSK